MTTGEHVEVFREEAKEGEARTFTKRFLETSSGDFRPWTEREWRILERLAARGDAPVADVVRFIDFDDSGLARLQTRDAGPTVDEWAALVPLRRSAPVLPYVFGDCPNWWALARQCLVALDKLHGQGFVHLDFRSDNVCIPWKPAEVERPGAGTAARAELRRARADRRRVLAPARRRASRAAAARTRAGLRVPVAAPVAGARRSPARQSRADVRARLALRHLQPGSDAVALPARARRRRRHRLDEPARTPRRPRSFVSCSRCTARRFPRSGRTAS